MSSDVSSDVSSDLAGASSSPAFQVGFLGVGQMGRPMVERLVAANWPTEVFVRRPELRAELEATGVSVADSAAAVAERADLLLVCFFSDSQVRDVLLDGGVLGALRRGSVLGNHVTGSPQLGQELQDAAPEGVTVLDMPVSGSADNIRAGQLTVLVGGEKEAFERVRPAVASYAQPIIHVGRLGDGQRMKLINNLLFTVNLRAALDAASLGTSMGIAPAELARVLQHCSGDSYAVRLLQYGSPEGMEAGVLPYLRKDVAAVREVAAEADIDLSRLGDQARWVDAD